MSPAPRSGRPSTHPRLIFGWREWVALPDLGIDAIKAKVDTGARTSAVHAFRPQRFDKNGEPWVRFLVHPLQDRKRPEIRAEAAIVAERPVKSSNGSTEMRLIIRTRLSVLGQSWPIELSLTNRDEMGFRMLVGREAMRGQCLVDPAGSFLSGEPAPEKRISSP